VIGNRARHRSSKQASSAGMSLYYKVMLAVHLENGSVTLRETPVPPRPEGFALLRLLAAGICNTDLELQRGYYGFSGTPGHEFVAEVVEADTPAPSRNSSPSPSATCTSSPTICPPTAPSSSNHSPPQPRFSTRCTSRPPAASPSSAMANSAS